jgi:hypothetical protein
MEYTAEYVSYSRIRETYVRFRDREHYSVSGTEKDMHEENIEHKEHNNYVGCGRRVF